MVKFRSRILGPDQGYKPCSLVELSLRASIGAILSKPQWWRKWQQEDGVVRERWLRELEEQTLYKLLYWASKHWDVGGWMWRAIKKVATLPEHATDDEKRAFIADACTRFEYTANFFDEDDFAGEYENGYYQSGDEEMEEDDDDYDDEEETEEERQRRAEERRRRADEKQRRRDAAKLAFIKQKNEQLQPFGQLLWCFALKETATTIQSWPLNRWPLPEWTSPPVNWTSVVRNATEMLINLRTVRLEMANSATTCTGVRLNQLEMDAICFHVNKAKEQLDKIRNCIVNTLDMVIQDNNLTVTSKCEGFISPGPANETWLSDSLVPVDLKTAFARQVSVLEGIPDEEKDWHPGSDNQVLDLVHPSLYCCVSGRTKRIAESGAVCGKSVVDHMHHIAFKATDVVYPGSTFYSWSNDVYQWIPSDVAVDENGHVKFSSYINNLHPEDNAAMYDSIASIFERFVPLFDRVLSALASEEDSGPQLDTSCDRDYFSDNYMIGYYMPPFPDAPERYVLEPDYALPYSIKGTTVQVIVKIAEIHLTPEKPQYPGGSWHIEGSDSEKIVATGLYYFGCDNITESKLSFRVIVQQPYYEQSDDLGVAAMYGLENEEMLVQSLGAATAIEDRCLVFPNTLQHKVEPFELADPTKPGVRKILAFFLVDPTKTIPSTSVVPPQQKEWLQRMIAPMLEAKDLPLAAIEEQLTHLVSDGMTLEEAKAFRLELMDARRSQNNFDDDEELHFSLCEH